MLLIFYKNNQMHITKITIYTKENLFTITVVFKDENCTTILIYNTEVLSQIVLNVFLFICFEL